jgi:hypothetical protein
MILFNVRAKVGNKTVLSCQQFNVKFGEPFCFDVEIEGVYLSITFSHEFNPNKEQPYLSMKATEGENKLHYILGNFNKHAVATRDTDFFTLQNKTYSFHLTVKCASNKIDHTANWLYSVTFYREDREHA